MAIFAAVATQGSFSKAAVVLGIPKSSVSHKVAQLEKTLGMTLLFRSTRHISLTEEGQLYLEKCREMINAAEAADRIMKGLREEPQGKLRISCPIGIVYGPLTDTIAEYKTRYPKVNIEVLATNERLDILRQGFDFALRFGPLPDSNLIAKPLAVSKPILVASPEYLTKHGTPRKPQDLINHTCLTWDRSNVWLLSSPKESVSVSVNQDVAVNDLTIAKHLAVKNVGICALVDIFLDDELEKGELIPVLPDYHVGEVTLYIVYHQRDMKNANVSRFLEIATAKFARD